MERRLAAILAADIVGFSRLMGEDEAGTLERLKACEADLIEPVVDQHGGRIFKRMGDGFLVEFASVISAVECSISWQETASAPLLFRIGIHLGDVMVEAEDLYGDGVNVAARLEAMAEPGGLCLSEDAQRLVRGKVDAVMEDLGEQQLKNIREPIRVYRLVGRFTPPVDAHTTEQTVAWQLPKILLAPFNHIGESSDASTLAAGVTVALAAALSHFEEFELIDPGSTPGIIAAEGAHEAGRQLGATFVLEGSLQLALGKTRIGVHLIDARTGLRVWSETFDRNVDDVFALQDDITALVASTVGEAFHVELARKISHKTISDLTDYELMLRGLEHLHRVNREDNQIARDIFQLVRDRKPDEYFPTICSVWTTAIALQFNWPVSHSDGLESGRELIAHVLRHHDRSAHAHRLMSRLYLLSGNHDQALAQIERAYQLNPYDSDILNNYGTILMWNGHANESLEKLERAVDINPYAPLYYKTSLSLAYLLVSRQQDGLEMLNSVEGEVGSSRYLRIAHLASLGRLEEAEAEARIVIKENPNFDLELLLEAYPFKRLKDQNIFGDALRLAGLGNITIRE